MPRGRKPKAEKEPAKVKGPTRAQIKEQRRATLKAIKSDVSASVSDAKVSYIEKGGFFSLVLTLSAKAKTDKGNLNINRELQIPISLEDVTV